MRITISTIETKSDYERALSELERLDDGARHSAATMAHINVLAMLVEAYEEEHFPMPDPDPIEVIKFYLEQQGADESELIGVIGSRTRVWEVLNRKRPLTLEMIRRLRDLGIPAEALLGAA
jgi:HTH-type transcriptional regulator/antitoxin HigA